MPLSQNLFSDQFVVVSATGQDPDGKPTIIGNFAIAVDDHSIVYAVTNADNPAVALNSVLIAAKGVFGNAILTVNATDINGVALPAETVTFSVVQKPAVAINLTVGTPATIDANTPPQPAGW